MNKFYTGIFISIMLIWFGFVWFIVSVSASQDAFITSIPADVQAYMRIDVDNLDNIDYKNYLEEYLDYKLFGLKIHNSHNLLSQGISKIGIVYYKDETFFIVDEKESIRNWITEYNFSFVENESKIIFTKNESSYLEDFESSKKPRLFDRFLFRRQLLQIEQSPIYYYNNDKNLLSKLLLKKNNNDLLVSLMPNKIFGSIDFQDEKVALKILGLDSVFTTNNNSSFIIENGYENAGFAIGNVDMGMFVEQFLQKQNVQTYNPFLQYINWVFNIQSEIVVIPTDDDIPNFIVILKDIPISFDVYENSLMQIIRSYLAYKFPLSKELILPDKTKAVELVADPENFIEDILISDEKMKIYSVSDRESQYEFFIGTLEDSKSLVITNQKNLLEQSILKSDIIKKESKFSYKGIQEKCSGNASDELYPFILIKPEYLEEYIQFSPQTLIGKVIRNFDEILLFSKDSQIQGCAY